MRIFRYTKDEIRQSHQEWEPRLVDYANRRRDTNLRTLELAPLDQRMVAVLENVLKRQGDSTIPENRASTLIYHGDSRSELAFYCVNEESKPGEVFLRYKDYVDWFENVFTGIPEWWNLYGFTFNVSARLRKYGKYMANYRSLGANSMHLLSLSSTYNGRDDLYLWNGDSLTFHAEICSWADSW